MMERKVMTRGEIYYIKNNKLEDGCKPMPDRPAVIVSNDMFNATSGTVQVVYMTMTPWQDMPTHVTSRSLDTVSYVTCEQIFTVNKNRVGTYAGELTRAELEEVDAALAVSLDLDFASAETKVVEKVIEKEVMREPTPEELDVLLDKRMADRLGRKRVEILPKDPDPMVLDARIVKAETERDIYRRLYEELFAVLAKR